MSDNRFEKMHLLLKQKEKRLDKDGINSLEKADGVVVVMDHQLGWTYYSWDANYVCLSSPTF